MPDYIVIIKIYAGLHSKLRNLVTFLILSTCIEPASWGSDQESATVIFFLIIAFSLDTNTHSRHI